MATLTETIAEELLDSLDDPDGIERVMTQHRGSKGPLYGGLARATMCYISTCKNSTTAPAG